MSNEGKSILIWYSEAATSFSTFLASLHMEFYYIAVLQNAPSEVKAVANYITLDVDHSGVAEAINKFLL